MRYYEFDKTKIEIVEKESCLPPVAVKGQFASFSFACQYADIERAKIVAKKSARVAELEKEIADLKSDISKIEKKQWFVVSH